MKEFSDQVRLRLTSQLIEVISRVLQKLLEYFNGTAIFAFKIPQLLDLAKTYNSNLNE